MRSVSLLFLFIAASATADTLQPIPELGKQAQAEKQIRSIFKDEFAKPAIADRIALAKKLLGQANETANDPAAKFMLLRDAQSVAAAAGDVKTALKAIDELGKSFLVRTSEYRESTLEQVAREIGSNERAVAFLEGCLVAIRDDEANEDYPAAVRVASLMTRAASQSGNRRIVDGVRTFAAEVREMQMEVSRIKTIMSRTRSTDPANDLATGKYVCFIKSDWLRGAAMLAKGGDARLKTAAEKELEQPTTPGGQFQTGNAWWEAGERQSPAGKKFCERRARFWYQQAYEHIGGLDRALIEKRIVESFSAPDTAVIFGGHCYVHYPQHMSWQEAKICCEFMGGHLAIIETEAEQRFVVNIAAGKRIFLGATDEEKEGDWRWVNNQPMRFSAWSPNEPSNGDNNTGEEENYLLLDTNALWNDVNGKVTQNAGFLCEWE